MPTQQNDLQKNGLITKENEHVASYAVLMKETAYQGMLMLLSDNFAIKNATLSFLLKVVSRTSEDRAAIALIIPTINVTLLAAVSPLFVINLISPEIITTLKQLEANDNLSIDDISNHRRKIAYIFRHAVIISGVLAPVVILIWLTSGPILQYIFKQQPAVANSAWQFLKWYSLSVLPAFIYFIQTQFIQSFQLKKIMAQGAASLLFCLLLSFSTGVGVLLPEQGVAGILLGYTAEPLITSLIYSINFCRHPSLNKFHFLKNLFTASNNQFLTMTEFMKKGIAITGTVVSEVLFGFGTAALAGVLGTKQQEVWALTMQYTLMNAIIAIHFPLSSAIQLGSTISTVDKQRIGKAGLAVSIIVGSILPAVFAISPGLLLGTNGQDDAVLMDLLKKITPIVSIASILDVIGFTFLFQVRMMNEIWTSTLVRMIAFCLGLGLTAMLSLATPLSIVGVAWGFMSGMSLSTLGLGLLWFKAIQNPNADRINATSAFSCTRFFSEVRHRVTQCTPNHTDKQTIEMQLT